MWTPCTRCGADAFTVERPGGRFCYRCLLVVDPVPPVRHPPYYESHASNCFNCERWIEKGMTHAAANDHCIRRGDWTPLRGADHDDPPRNER